MQRWNVETLKRSNEETILSTTIDNELNPKSKIQSLPSSEAKGPKSSEPVILRSAAETPHHPYVADPYSYRRRVTREVMVGKVGVGGNNPIRVQSMTTTRTQNVEATLAQTLRLVEAGCEIVRI